MSTPVLEEKIELDDDHADIDNDEESPEEEKQWQAFLPLITEEMTGPIFSCFLRRAAAVLFSIDFSAPHLPLVLEDGLNPVFKLTNISVGLLKMYYGTNDESQRLSFLELVAQNKAFVYFVMQLACRVIQLCGDAELQVWLIPLARFLELIFMTLELSGDVKIQLEEQGLLVRIISQLNHLPMDVVQNLSEENVLLQTILLSVKILFLCAANLSNIQSHVHHKYSQAPFLLLQSPNVTLRLITRALLSCLMPKCGDSTHYVLRDDEIIKLTDMLTSIESLLSTDMSLQMPLKMTKYLTNVAENASILLQRGIVDLISPLADRLTGEEEQKILAELIWKLMQFESGSYSVEVATTIGGKELNQENSDCDSLPEEVLESISPAEAVVEFTELLLRFLMKTLLPYEGIPLEEGLEELSDATWYTISECFLLMSWIIAESDEHTKKDIIHCAAALPGCCRSMQLAFYIGTLIGNEAM